MGWLNSIVSAGIGDTVAAISGAVKPFIATAVDKQKFTLELEKIVQQNFEAVEQSLQAELAAKQRVIEAEMAQGDNFTKRARPSVVYAGLVFIFFNHVLLPLVLGIAKSAGADIQLADFQTELPLEFWVAWGGICTTWVIGRSHEKSGHRHVITQAITGNQRHLKSVSSLLD